MLISSMSSIIIIMSLCTSISMGSTVSWSAWRISTSQEKGLLEQPKRLSIWNWNSRTLALFMYTSCMCVCTVGSCVAKNVCNYVWRNVFSHGSSTNPQGSTSPTHAFVDLSTTCSTRQMHACTSRDLIMYLLLAGCDGETKLQVFQCCLHSEVVPSIHHVSPYLSLALDNTVTSGHLL